MMEKKNWDKIKELFSRALDKQDEARIAWLHKECGDDTALFNEVVKLLEARQYSSPIDTPLDKLPETLFSPENEDDLHREVGKYKLIEVIGTGGMGIVYLAQRKDGEFEHHVALKFLRFGMSGNKLIRRFKKERQILAKLQHPNIARLYDGGVMKDGTPWFSMEYVDGLPVTEYAETNHLTFEERLHLFRKICSTVQFAHQNLVIHRDLKPSNIMVKNNGEPILLDFGLARMEEETSGKQHEVTRSSQNWMTLEYASPEQIRSEKLTTATDIYQLGLLLHELLTGRRPYSVKGSTPSEAEQIICNTRPANPSTKAKTLEETPIAASPAELHRRLKGDLDTIILKALEKEPGMRYSSVERMSDDIYRHLSGQPIRACKATLRYRMGKFFKRHRKTVMVACLLVAGLFTLNAYYTSQLTEERDTAQKEAERAEAVKDFMVSMISEADPSQSPGEPVTVRDLLQQNTDEIIDKFTEDPDIALELLRAIGLAQNRLGDRADARETLEKAYDLIYSRNIELEPHDLASFKLMLSSTYTGNSERKTDLLNRAKLLVDNNSDVPLMRASITRSLAYLKYTKANYEQAVQLINSTFDAACSGFGIEQDPRWCTGSLFDGYFFLTRAGYPEEAFSAAEKHYEITMELFTEKGHPERALTGQLYATALSDHHRPNEAIELLNTTIEELETYGDSGSRRMLGLNTVLAYAESAKGNDKKAVELWNWVLEQVINLPPDAFNRSIQLNLMIDRLLNLERLEEARQAHDKYAPGDEFLTHQTKWGHRYNEIRMEMIENRSAGISHERWLTIIETFEENYDDMLPNLLVYALSDAVGREDEDSALYWHNRIEVAENYNPYNDYEGLMSLARYMLHQNSTSRAEELINKTEVLLASRNEDQGPRVARLFALQAEYYCKINELTMGREALRKAKQYWNQANGHKSGMNTLEKYAFSCS